MICSVRSLAVQGIRGLGVSAECYISNGLPGFDIVGLPDAAVKEARERVRAAAKTSGFSFPVSRITVNLAPANVKKAGSQYDLPILLSILAASGAVRKPKNTCAFLGEVSLDGQVRPVSGVLPMALAAAESGIEHLFVPAENAAEATLARGPKVYAIETVRQLATCLICISAIMMPFNSYTNATYFTLRSGGQTLVTFLFDSCFVWGVCIPLAFCLSRFTAMTIIPLYAICQSLDLIKCLIGAFMLKQGKWIQNLTT